MQASDTWSMNPLPWGHETAETDMEAHKSLEGGSDPLQQNTISMSFAFICRPYSLALWDIPAGAMEQTLVIAHKVCSYDCVLDLADRKGEKRKKRLLVGLCATGNFVWID